MSTKKEIALLLGVLGVAAGALSYYFGYTKLEEKAAELNSQAAELETKITKYESWEANRETYIAETEEMKTKIGEIVGDFPSYALVEDDMKLAYQLDYVDPSYYRYINAMSFADTALVYTTDYSATASVEEETGVSVDAVDSYPKYSLYDNVVNYTMSSTYEGLKDMVASIYAQSNKRGITAVTLGYDNSNGLLNGNVTMDSYYLVGSDKPYSQPSLTPVPKGTENPFGTVDVFENAPEEAASEAETVAE